MPDFMSLFSTQNKLRCESTLGFNHPLNSWSLNDWMVALAGEVGEACNVAKKIKRVTDNVAGNDKNATYGSLLYDLMDELADVFIYLDLIASRLEQSTPWLANKSTFLQRMIIDKFNKTSEKIAYDVKLNLDATVDTSDSV